MGETSVRSAIERYAVDRVHALHGRSGCPHAADPSVHVSAIWLSAYARDPHLNDPEVRLHGETNVQALGRLILTNQQCRDCTRQPDLAGHSENYLSSVGVTKGTELTFYEAARVKVG
jgi:hypothetical protein